MAPAYIEDSPFDYVPSLVGGAIFVALFSLLILVHTGLTIKSKTWFGLAAILGGITELIGWAARLWAHKLPNNLNLFLAQIVTLTIAPTFFSASCYFLFGALSKALTAQRPLIRPKIYSIVFITCDLIALVIQSVGGAKAAQAAKGDGEKSQLRLGSRISLAGVLFQLITMLAFSALLIEYFIRLRRDNRQLFSLRPVKATLLGLLGATATIVARNTFRSVEMAQGYGQHLATSEVYFLVLDATLMVICFAFLAQCHPLFTINRLKEHHELERRGSDEKALTANV